MALDKPKPRIADPRIALALAVDLARCRLEPNPEPGDLVVECSLVLIRPSSDAIGWLLGYGMAPYNADGSGGKVWDVMPLSGIVGADGRPYQRWENAEFMKVPPPIVRRLELAPPDGWDRGRVTRAAL